jgi:antitoxin ParD1/3/4
MATMNISLPDPMRDWVEAQIKTGQYANNSDYLRDLIRKDQRNREKLKALQEAITQGFDSGRAGELDLQTIKQKARKQAGLLP